MSLGGTAKYDHLSSSEVPELVMAAVQAARHSDFELSVHPATGRLLAALAAGVPAGGIIGETGTGTGAGLGWLASGARPDVRLLSVEIDEVRAATAAEVCANHTNIEVIHGDNEDLFARGPFDMLVLDGGWGAGKGGDARGTVDVTQALGANGVMTVDDFTPMTTWPPTFGGQVDSARMFWLEHQHLLTTEVSVGDGLAVLVCRRRPQ